MGSIFHLPLAVMREDKAETSVLTDSGLILVGATPDPTALPLDSLSTRRRLAIALGNEGDGLSREWLDHCTELVRIPMRDADVSLNVAVAAGIILHSVRAPYETSD